MVDQYGHVLVDALQIAIVTLVESPGGIDLQFRGVTRSRGEVLVPFPFRFMNTDILLAMPVVLEDLVQGILRADQRRGEGHVEALIGQPLPDPRGLLHTIVAE